MIIKEQLEKEKTLNDTEHNKNKKKKKKRREEEKHTHYKQKIILDVKYNMYKNQNIYMYICIDLYADIHTQTQITICIRRPAEEKQQEQIFNILVGQ